MATPENYVSIIIPCRNEEKFIGACLESIFLNNYPKDKYEVLIIDGMSTDKTRQIALSFKEKIPLKIIENPKKITSVAMNIGIQNAKGSIITKSDAHSIYPKNYISESIVYFKKYNADVVGGVAEANTKINSKVGQSIVLVLRSFFGAGNSIFRLGSSEPMLVDTVFGGFFRKEVFKKVGLFNERLVGSQDIEMNMRIKTIGGKILLVPSIKIIYYPKSTFVKFFSHNIRDGIWAILPMRYGARMFKLRHLLPFFFVAGLIGSFVLSLFVPFFLYFFYLGLALWILAALYFSLTISMREKNIILFPFVFIAFAVRHFGYGIGSIVGFIRLATG